MLLPIFIFITTLNVVLLYLIVMLCAARVNQILAFSFFFFLRHLIDDLRISTLHQEVLVVLLLGHLRHLVSLFLG